MAIPAFDLGIHAADVAPLLASAGIVEIVGFERSGKSTLSEILQAELGGLAPTVLLQNAAVWLGGRTGSERWRRGERASVDLELSEALSRLETDRRACWIVDDAEVMLAYASEGMLRNISRMLGDGLFSLVLIRNRFVSEHAGWFHERASLLRSVIPRFFLEPLDAPAALGVARSHCRGVASESQAHWLAEMSGGIPGLISELSRYAPTFVNLGSSEGIERLAERKRRLLRLDEPPRRSLIRALQQQILPPPQMLAKVPRAEIGALMIGGMVRRDYAFRDDPFCGGFWSLVAGEQHPPLSIPQPIADTALDLEIALLEQGLIQDLCAALGLEPIPPEGELTQAFARCLFCESTNPEVVRPLTEILAEVLGRVQIAKILRGRGIDFAASLDGPELTALLLGAGGR